MSFTLSAVLAEVSMNKRPFLGSFLAIARKMSFTLSAVLAEVSMNKRPFSSAYAEASSYSTILLVVRSALLPDRAMTMLGLACRCNSFTQDLALSNVSALVMSYTTMAA